VGLNFDQKQSPVTIKELFFLDVVFYFSLEVYGCEENVVFDSELNLSTSSFHTTQYMLLETKNFHHFSVS
jgi:hypothetical protein